MSHLWSNFSETCFNRFFFQLKTNPWSNAVTTVNGEKKTYHYDAEHERKRKEQLRRLFDRTQEQVRNPIQYLILLGNIVCILCIPNVFLRISL